MKKINYIEKASNERAWMHRSMPFDLF